MIIPKYEIGQKVYIVGIEFKRIEPLDKECLFCHFDGNAEYNGKDITCLKCKKKKSIECSGMEKIITAKGVEILEIRITKREHGEIGINYFYKIDGEQYIRNTRECCVFATEKEALDYCERENSKNISDIKIKVEIEETNGNKL